MIYNEWEHREQENKEMKYNRLWKKVRNGGLILGLAGLSLVGSQLYEVDKTKDKIVNQKQAKKICYGLGSMLVGYSLLSIGENKLEKGLKNEN